MGEHDCFDYRQHRILFEGDDVLHEVCTRCGNVRYESDGERPMAWFVDRTNPSGHRYAYANPHNTPGAPEVWKPITYTEVSDV